MRGLCLRSSNLFVTLIRAIHRPECLVCGVCSCMCGNSAQPSTKRCPMLPDDADCPTRRPARCVSHGWHASRLEPDAADDSRLPESSAVPAAETQPVATDISAAFLQHQMQACHRYRCAMMPIFVITGCITIIQLAWLATAGDSPSHVRLLQFLPVPLKLIHTATLFSKWWTHCPLVFMVVFEAAHFTQALTIISRLVLAPVASTGALARVLVVGTGTFACWWYGVMLPKPAVLDHLIVAIEVVGVMAFLGPPSCRAIEAGEAGARLLPRLHATLDGLLRSILGARPAPYSCICLVWWLQLSLAGVMLCFKAACHRRAFAAFCRARGLSDKAPASIWPPGPLLEMMFEVVLVGAVMLACMWQLVQVPASWLGA